ncbi:MAG TPA: hypothetical protein VME66_09990, partial [Candidatus Acidoferrales bacterium]|nr:hypothetical protein [Candidatus Acidoferrales bacterium]
SATLLSPLNVLTAFPTGSTATAYTPLWDAYLAMWSSAAVAKKKNVLVKSAADVYTLAASKTITGPNGKAFGPVGFVVNCPVVGYLDKAPQ